MFQSIISTLGHVFATIPFTSATWFILAFIAFFVFLFARASKSPNSPVFWEHLIIDSQNDRASPYKVGFLIGLIVSTWIVINLVDRDKLSYDIFGLYLTYLLGGAGWNATVKAKDTPVAKDTKA